MQAVKWRIAFFYFDMNTFQIRICLAAVSYTHLIVSNFGALLPLDLEALS